MYVFSTNRYCDFPIMSDDYLFISLSSHVVVTPPTGQVFCQVTVYVIWGTNVLLTDFFSEIL